MGVRNGYAGPRVSFRSQSIQTVLFRFAHYRSSFCSVCLSSHERWCHSAFSEDFWLRPFVLYFTNSIGAAFGVMLMGFVLVNGLGCLGHASSRPHQCPHRSRHARHFEDRQEPELGDVGTGDISTSDDAGRPRLLLSVAAFTGLASFIMKSGSNVEHALCSSSHALKSCSPPSSLASHSAVYG